jgi:hypothetical protein
MTSRLRRNGTFGPPAAPRRGVHRRTAPHDRRRSSRWDPLLAAAFAAVVAVLLALDLVVPPSPTRARADPLRPPDRICPVRSCAAYPRPGQVKGITLAALGNYALFTRSAEAQVRAARVWGANAIRLQIVQDTLVGEAGRRLSSWYMADIRRLVRYALVKHLTVILNAQTEAAGRDAASENLPTRATYSLWRYLTDYYGRNPHVVFDLFNEPRSCTWSQWHAAFQPLVNYLRSIGSDNQLWVEGLWWGSTFAGGSLLRGQGVVYSFHHPGSPWPWQTPVGPSTWDSAFGYLSREHIPLVDGEFVNFNGGYYWPRSTQMVIEYLRYLSARRIGVVAWSLRTGIMTATSRLTSAVSEPQGAGRLIWRYFHHEALPRVPAQTEQVPFRFGRGR